MINQKVSCIALCALLQLANSASDYRRYQAQPQELPLALYVTDCANTQYGNENGLYVRVEKTRIRALCPGQWAPDHELQSHDYYYMSVKNQRGRSGNPLPKYYITALDTALGFCWKLFATGEWGTGRVMTGEKDYMRIHAVPECVKSQYVHQVADLVPIPSVFYSTGEHRATANVQSLSVQSLATMPILELKNLSKDIATYMVGRARCPEVDSFLTHVQASVGKQMLVLMQGMDPTRLMQLMTMMTNGASDPTPQDNISPAQEQKTQPVTTEVAYPNPQRLTQCEAAGEESSSSDGMPGITRPIEESTCAICQDVIEQQHELETPCCSNKFHRHCLKSMLQVRPLTRDERNRGARSQYRRCPMCKNDWRRPCPCFTCQTPEQRRNSLRGEGRLENGTRCTKCNGSGTRDAPSWLATLDAYQLSSEEQRMSDGEDSD